MSKQPHRVSVCTCASRKSLEKSVFCGVIADCPDECRFIANTDPLHLHLIGCLSDRCLCVIWWNAAASVWGEGIQGAWGFGLLGISLGGSEDVLDVMSPWWPFSTMESCVSHCFAYIIDLVPLAIPFWIIVMPIKQCESDLERDIITIKPASNSGSLQTQTQRDFFPQAISADPWTSSSSFSSMSEFPYLHSDMCNILLHHLPKNCDMHVFAYIYNFDIISFTSVFYFSYYSYFLFATVVL